MVTQLTPPPPRGDCERSYVTCNGIAENCIVTCAVKAKKREKRDQILFTLKIFER